MATKNTPFIVTKKRCTICEGTGLERRKKEEQCLTCIKNAICFKCENRKDKGLYAECSNCFGAGEIFYDKDKKKILRSNFL